MARELIVCFGTQLGQEFRTHADSPMAPEAARRWLDEQFLAFDCEPLRASGKVLVVDKLLALAEAAGQATFEREPAWALQYAGAALAVTGHDIVKVDLNLGSVSF
jgi:hypothetical protein